MGCWGYYLAWILLAYAVRYPALALGALLCYLVRDYLPDPFVLIRTAGRIGSLRRQIAANPSNVTARRDLAAVLLERRRPAAARDLLREAIQRDPQSAELSYLLGCALLESGDAEGSLAPLVRAVEIDPKLRMGEPYLVAADALYKLDRLEEAEDALERYVSANSSSIEGWVRLARVRGRRKDPDGARKALAEALHTFQALPGYHRRRQFGWWLRAQLARLGM
jgi:tetratricopeptide (TPR) repeat protein